MGKQNRQRRREKQRRQDHRQRVGHRGSAGPVHGRQGRPNCSGPEAPDLSADLIEAALSEAAAASRAGNPVNMQACLEVLVAAWQLAGEMVPGTVDACLQRALRRTWSNGWQPGDLARALRKRGAPAGLAIDVIAADAETYRHQQWAEESWTAQLGDIDARRWWKPGVSHLAQWRQRHGLTEAETMASAVVFLAELWRLPRLPRLCTPPAEWAKAGPGAPRRVANGIDAKILTRVRALLAKAESTTFVSEAEALTAKAQQLIARHAIDRAMLDAGTTGEAPAGRRLAVDDPYAGAKALLLSEVANAGRCRSVWSRELGFSTVLGFASDLDAVEVLFTSLLVQATGFMVAAGSGPEQRRARSRGFRSAFLTAFAVRVGQRLAEANRATVVEGQKTHGPSLLPVLASREQAVDALVDETFPSLRNGRRVSYDAAGWAAGAAAAELADLASGPQLAAEPAGA